MTYFLEEILLDNLNTISLLLTTLISLGIAVFLGPVIIPVLHRLKFGQEIKAALLQWADLFS